MRIQRVRPAGFTNPLNKRRVVMTQNTLAETLQLEIAELMVQALNLDVAASEIGPDDPLYGDGLGLDSIDILEVALVVSKRYGLQLKADSEDNHKIFSSLRSLAEYVAAHKTK
jgi:acyl carrier protein